jgi:WXG100 family type VII secretion target
MSNANISAEQASYDAIRSAVTNLQGFLQGLNSKVKGQVATVIGGWQGGAAQAFNSVMEQWDAGSNKTTQALSDFESALASVGAQVTQSEQENQQTVAKTGAAMLNL